MISNLAKSMSSPEHIAKCMKEGERAEELFALATGLEVEKGSNNWKHIDFILKGEHGIWGRVDVKSNKASFKRGFILVEMVSVNGKDGWASRNSKADFIAFQVDTGFLIVPKDLLRKITIERSEPFIPSKVKRANRLQAKDHLYKWLGRKDRKDVFTYIKREDLRPYASELIYIEV